MLSRAVLVSAFASFVFAAAALGHDYWLAPESFSASVGREVVVRLFRGEAPKADGERPFEPERAERFSLLWGDEARGLKSATKDGEVPVARITPKAEGGHLIAMERRPATITLEADKFAAYLKDEGLDVIIARREELGESRVVGRERYRRYLKALVQVANRRDKTYRRELGHRLEILLLADPATLRRGDSMPVRILFEARPLAGARVFAHSCEAGEVHPQSATTDRDGLVTFRLVRPGLWLVRLVHMRRAKAGDEVDWESFWAAYTFGL